MYDLWESTISINIKLSVEKVCDFFWWGYYARISLQLRS